jgi:hypothetical protein
VPDPNPSAPQPPCKASLHKGQPAPREPLLTSHREPPHRGPTPDRGNVDATASENPAALRARSDGKPRFHPPPPERTPRTGSRGRSASFRSPPVSRHLQGARKAPGLAPDPPVQPGVRRSGKPPPKNLDASTHVPSWEVSHPDLRGRTKPPEGQPHATPAGEPGPNQPSPPEGRRDAPGGPADGGVNPTNLIPRWAHRNGTRCGLGQGALDPTGRGGGAPAGIQTLGSFQGGR